ncbi:MAG: molecular chaperone HtpG [Clostridia bacterium]
MKNFKTESKKMLDMMINSIYTNREIFIRELLSNSSDAIDKLYYNTLSGGMSGYAREDFAINIDINKDARTLTLSDNGIGMTADELENNLGTIAKSGSLDFKTKADKKDDVNIIGQFGVGFYSVFMVSDKVEVFSRAAGSEECNVWTSKGAEGYDIKASDALTSNGTKIVMHIKPNVEGEDGESFDEYLEEYRLRELVKKYSNYIKYPIKMMVTKYKDVGEGEDKKEEEYQEQDTLNDMIPLWKKQKSDIKQEEYNDLYQNMFYDSEAPLKTIHTSAEGNVEYKALLYIPSHAPQDYYSKNYEKGLKLYTNGVLITDKCADLLPDYFSFVKGLVDTELTLNISRETIQHDRRLKTIAKNVEKKIKSELVDMMKDNRDDYNKFYKNFGLQLKYGIYTSWGMNKDMLQDLIMFYSIKQDKMISLQEYVDAMLADQKFIYYANGNTIDAIKSQPQSEKVLDAGYDILCMTEEVDEFAVKTINKYAEKEFKSTASDSLGIDDTAEDNAEYKELVDFVKEALGNKVEKVKISSRLKSHPVCLSSEGELSIEMEKVFAQMPQGKENAMKAKKILEINANHPIFEKAKELFANDKDKLKVLAEVMLDEAMLIQGLEIDNQTSLADKIFGLIAKN